MAERPNIKRQQIKPSRRSGAVWRGLRGCRRSTTKQAVLRCGQGQEMRETPPKYRQVPGAAECDPAVGTLP